MILGYFLLLLFVFLSNLGMIVFVLCPFLLWFSEIPPPIPCSGYLNFPSSTFGGFWIASRVCVACGSLFLKEVVNELSQLLQLLSLRRKAIGFLNVVFFFRGIGGHTVAYLCWNPLWAGVVVVIAGCGC